MLGELLPESPCEFPEILGADLFVGWCIGLPRDTHKCQGGCHLGAHVGHALGTPRKTWKGLPCVSSWETFLGTPTSTWGNLLWRVVRRSWAQNSGGAFSRISLKQYPMKFEHHNHVTFFSPTGLGIFTFILLRNPPLSLSWETNLLVRAGNSFAEVTTKTCWPGSHCDPVWWPYTTLLCSIRQQSYNLTSRRPAFVPAFLGPLQGCPLAIYRKKWKLSQTGWPGSRWGPGHPINPAPHSLLSCQDISPLPGLQCPTLLAAAPSLQSWETCLRNPFANGKINDY